MGHLQVIPDQLAGLSTSQEERIREPDAKLAVACSGEDLRMARDFSAACVEESPNQCVFEDSMRCGRWRPL